MEIIFSSSSLSLLFHPHHWIYYFILIALWWMLLSSTGELRHITCMQRCPWTMMISRNVCNGCHVWLQRKKAWFAICSSVNQLDSSLFPDNTKRCLELAKVGALLRVERENLKARNNCSHIEGNGQSRHDAFRQPFVRWLSNILYNGKPLAGKAMTYSLARHLINLYEIYTSQSTKWLIDSGVAPSSIYIANVKALNEICTHARVQTMLHRSPDQWNENVQDFL